MIATGDLQQALYRWARAILWRGKTSLGATTTSVPLAGANLPVNLFAGHFLHVLSGPAAGSVRRIIANTPTTLTLESALPAAPQAGDEAVVLYVVQTAESFSVLPRTALGAGESDTIWTPGAGRRLRIVSLHVTVSSATVLTVRLGTTTIWERDFSGAGGADVVFSANGIRGPVDGALTVTSSAAATVGATAVGTEE